MSKYTDVMKEYTDPSSGFLPALMMVTVRSPYPHTFALHFAVPRNRVCILHGTFRRNCECNAIF